MKDENLHRKGPESCQIRKDMDRNDEVEAMN